MKFCFLTFNFPRDYALCATLHANLRKQYPEADFVWCIESRHSGYPAPDGVQMLIRDFNRGGNLCFTEALHAITRLYAELAEKYDGIIKIDADTYLHAPYIWTDYLADGGDVAFIPHIQNRICGNGCCYALSSRAAKRFSELPPQKFDAQAFNVRGREDMFFTGLAAEQTDFYIAMIPRNRVSWCDIATQPGSRAVAAHLGYLNEQDIVTRLSDITQTPFPHPAETDYAKKLTAFAAEKKLQIPRRTAAFNLKGERLNPAKPPK